MLYTAVGAGCFTSSTFGSTLISYSAAESSESSKSFLFWLVAGASRSSTFDSSTGAVNAGEALNPDFEKTATGFTKLVMAGSAIAGPVIGSFRCG